MMSDFQDDDEFDGADNKFKEASAEENAFDGACAEESAERARSHRAGNLAGYAVGTANEPKEDKEEENASGNCKKPAGTLLGEVTAGKKRARREHTCRWQGTWPFMRQGRRTIPRIIKKRKMR